MKRGYRSAIAAAVVSFCCAPVSLAVSPPEAMSRLRASVAAAVEASARLEKAEAEIRARQKGLSAESSAGSPFVEFQTEGRGASFDRKSNAADYLRVGAPFLLPWQHSRARQLRGQAKRELESSSRHQESVQVARVAQLWLESAEVLARQDVVTKRLAAVDRALMLQRARLSHGEIAGIEVLQLELDRAREASRAAELKAEFEAVSRSLGLICLEGLQLPKTEDLRSLAEHFSGVLRDEGLRPDGAPRLRAARAQAETAAARAQLVHSTAWGTPEADIEWERIPALQGVPGHNAMGLRLSLPLPIGKSGRLNREAAAAEARAVKAAAKLTELEFEEELGAARAAYEGARTRMKVLAPGLQRLDDAEHSLAEQVRLGAITSVVYLDVKSRLDEMRMESISAASALLRARLEVAGLLASSEIFPLKWSTSPEVSP